jgi:hypothetical protein
MMNTSLSAGKLFGIGLILIGCGLALLSPVQGQDQSQPTATATRYQSIFDAPPAASAASPTPSPTVMPSPTVTQAAVEDAQATSVPQVTRVQSIFDAPPQQPAATQPPASTGDTGGQPTRVPSIFDAPPPADTGGQPTRIPSMFDAQPPADTGGQPTRVPSLFDSRPPADTGAAPAQPAVPSVFDSAPASAIRYQGEEQPDRAYCLSCHANTFMQMSLPSGEALSVTIDEDTYLASVHGQHGTDGYRCIRCHVGMNEYPHPEIAVETARDLTIDFSTSCDTCHPSQYQETLDGTHMVALASGNKDAAVCSDCHGDHDISALSDRMTGVRLPDADITSVQMCSSCHTEVYDRYASSVHGKALLEGSQDAPTCADCHGVHDTEGPSDSSFRLFSPQTCAECHADEPLMAKYGISTDVFDTYVADFHGTTVAIFQNTAPDQPFNAPVCVDCHGVHNIMAMDDAASPALKENLVMTCQRCHPSATTNFPDSWMSHYQPSLERTPLVFLANGFYMIGIPTIIGGLGVFVASDVRRRRRDKR